MRFLLLEDLERAGLIALGRGDIISRDDMANNPGDYPVYSSSATENGEFGRYGKYMFEDERITWSIDGGGRLFYRNKHRYSVTNVCGWLKVNTDTLMTKYVYYCLYYQWLHIKFDYTYKAHPSVIKKIYKIPLLTLEEQNRIVKQLDKINVTIEKNANMFVNFDEIIKSRFIEMFGLLETSTKNFTKDKLKNLCEKITDGKHGGCTSEMGTGRYFVGAREIYDDAVHYDTAPEINLSEFEKDYKRCNVEIGDFLIVNTGATIGKSAIAVDQRTEFTLLQKSVALLKVKREILNPVFLQYCYKVNDGMYKVDSASAQPNLLLSKIKSTEIYVPPIALQNEFATFVDQIKKLKISIQYEIDLYNELLEKKMNEYFG